MPYYFFQHFMKTLPCRICDEFSNYSCSIFFSIPSRGKRTGPRSWEALILWNAPKCSFLFDEVTKIPFLYTQNDYMSLTSYCYRDELIYLKRRDHVRHFHYKAHRFSFTYTRKSLLALRFLICLFFIALAKSFVEVKANLEVSE